MILLNDQFLKQKSRMNPSQFMVFMYAIPMGEDIDMKELSRLTNLSPDELTLLLNDLKSMGYYNSRMNSKFIGDIAMRGEQKRKTKKPKFHFAYKECLDLYDKGFMTFLKMNNNPGLIKIDWGSPVERRALNKIINELEDKFIARKKRKPTAGDLKESLGRILQYMMNNDFWKTKILPHILVKNLDKVILEIISNGKKAQTS
jgi:hypothetical protein